MGHYRRATRRVFVNQARTNWQGWGRKKKNWATGPILQSTSSAQMFFVSSSSSHSPMNSHTREEGRELSGEEEVWEGRRGRMEGGGDGEEGRGGGSLLWLVCNECSNVVAILGDQLPLADAECGLKVLPSFCGLLCGHDFVYITSRDSVNAERRNRRRGLYLVLCSHSRHTHSSWVHAKTVDAAKDRDLFSAVSAGMLLIPDCFLSKVAVVIG